MPTAKKSRRFGRRHAIDRRDAAFGVAVRRTTGRKMWSESRYWFDQGELSCCVGAMWYHWLACSPVMGQYLSPVGIYELAQLCDEWPGEDYEGTSVRAGAKVLQKLGFIERYEWATSIDAIISAVLLDGPVGMGTDWHAGMDSPGSAKEWRLAGRNLGGHAWLITGVDTKLGLFRTRNSHLGNARGFIPIDDVATLLGRDGEACLAIERKGAL